LLLQTAVKNYNANDPECFQMPTDVTAITKMFLIIQLTKRMIETHLRLNESIEGFRKQSMIISHDFQASSKIFG